MLNTKIWYMHENAISFSFYNISVLQIYGNNIYMFGLLFGVAANDYKKKN